MGGDAAPVHPRHLPRRPGRILVVDDDPGITTLLSTVLAYEGFSVQVALSGADALRVAPAFRAQLVLLDVMLPDADGFEVHRALLADGMTAPVLYVTAREKAEDRSRGLSLGAEGYLTKPFTLEELVAKIRAVLRRDSPDRVLVFADLELDDEAGVARRAGREIRLTPTERSFLRYLMRNPRRVLSKARILEHVWPYDFDGPDGIVETYVSYLRRKIDFTEPRLIHTIRGVGYSLRLPRAQSAGALVSPEEA